MYTSSGISLFYRSQGLKTVLRWIVQSCQVYINEALQQKDDHIEIFKELLNKSVSLVQSEIPSVFKWY